jgi:hypothetical protein
MVVDQGSIETREERETNRRRRSLDGEAVDENR